MSVALADGTICLRGDCSLEEAEALQQLLIDHPAAAIDWSGCGSLHTAILQVLMVAGRRVNGDPADGFLRRMVAPMLPPA